MNRRQFWLIFGSIVITAGFLWSLSRSGTRSTIALNVDCNNGQALVCDSTGNFVAGAAGGVGVSLLDAADGTTAVANEFSGLVLDANSRLAIRQDCADQNELRWDETNSKWVCSGRDVISVSSGSVDLATGIALNACTAATSAITATGATDGDDCHVTPPIANVQIGLDYFCYISAAGQVKMYACCRITAGCADVNAATYEIKVLP